MSKTLTIRVSDEEYEVLKKVAKKQRRPISNFITHAVLNAIANLSVVDKDEMEEILEDKELMADLAAAHKDVEEGRYRIVS